MPRSTPRKKLRNRLLKDYIAHQHSRRRRQKRRNANRQKLLQLLNLEHDPDSTSSDSSTSDSSDSGSTANGSDSSPSTSSSSSSSSSAPDLDADGEILASMEMEMDLAEIWVPSEEGSSPSESDSSSSSSDGSDSGDEADDEGPRFSRPGLGRFVRGQLQDLYSRRYHQSRSIPVPRPPAQIHHVLSTTKAERPDHFRQILRVNPTTFDQLVAAIQNDPIFFNSSNNPQIPVEEQLAIALYRFGHDGNAAGHAAVARWAGVGQGSVGLHTRRVMTAILRRSFMDNAVRWPTEEEKEEAKKWVEQHSCRAWRNGWLLVDGSLIPICFRPFWYGESYFDRKCNYSLNVQVRFCLKQVRH